MGYTVKRFEATPNPTAFKCILDRVVSDRPRAFLDASSAESCPLAAALFAISGVRNVLFSDDWVTVNTTPGTDLRPVKAAVRRVLEAAP